jgi:hypothetical protein
MADAVHKVFSDQEVKLAVIVLFGKPGRGKTFLCTKLCEASSFSQEMNASSERRGEDLREAFEKFVRSASMAHDGVVSLFMDEADGLGEIGQLTTASFLSELSSLCRSWKVRIRILFACNDISLMHSAILSRAHIVSEVPRPTREQLVEAGRVWAAENCPELPESMIHEAARFAGGDYRTMLQGLVVSSAAAGIPMTNSHSSIICPKEFADLMLAPELNPNLEHILNFLRASWEKGYRDDVMQVWVDQILTVAASHERRLLLVTISRKLRHITPVSLLQVYGVFVRECRKQ